VGKISSYATLVQAVSDWTHRADLAANGFVDYFVQAAQASIERDIPDLNFGNYIALQEAAYGPYTITNGVTPVPDDWLGAKVITVSDGVGDSFTLIFKGASWIYDWYPLRQAAGIPAYIARDLQRGGYTTPQSFLTASGQTIFPLAANVDAGAVLVSLDGATLTAGLDFTISGAALVLSDPTVSGQALAVTTIENGGGQQYFTATGGQTAFTLSQSPRGSVLVALDGSTLVPDTDYSVSGTTLTLTTGALAGQILSVIYAVTYSSATLIAGSGQIDFTLPIQGASVIAASLDGSMLVGGADYVSSDGILTLTYGALQGQTLLVYYINSGATPVFIFGPYPDSPYIIQGTYYAKAPLLSAAQATNWMVDSNEAADVLLAACMVEAGVFLKDLTMVQTWEARYQTKLKALVDQDKAERWGAGTLAVNVG